MELLAQCVAVSKDVRVGKRTKRILNQVSLDIHEGDFICITGASGSGKSTLLNILGGLDSYSDGEYFYDRELIDSEAKRNKIRKDQVSMIVQNFALIQDMTVLNNVLLAKKDRKKALRLLKRFGVLDLKNEQVKNLSGGEKQRVAIARALMKNPRLLLADEPTGALDSKNSMNLMEVLKELHASGVTIVLVTHNEELARDIEMRYHMVDGHLDKSHVSLNTKL